MSAGGRGARAAGEGAWRWDPVRDAPAVVGDRSRGLLTDGTPVLLRVLGAIDTSAVVALYRALPERDLYLRFDTAHPRELEALVRRSIDPETGAISVGAFVAEVLVGVAHLLPIAVTGGEVAVAVAHRWQARGVATLLLELLVTLARRAGVESLDAEVLTQNVRMLQVFTDLGLPVQVHRDGNDARVRISLRQDVAGGGPGTP